MNKSILESRPHKIIDDLAVTYHILVSEAATGIASTAVTNDILKKWDVTLDEVDAAALENLQTLQKSTIQSMSQVLSKMMGTEIPMIDGDMGLYVCSNENQMFGASCLLDMPFMAHVVEQYGVDGQVTIIPSSTHEILLVSRKDLDSSTLKTMIQDVNSSTVDIEDQLSDHAYIYDANRGLFSM